MTTIYFDMDGTIANLYAEQNWLDDLLAEKTKPYRNAKPMVNMREFAKILNQLQIIGYRIGIISWTSRDGSAEYNERIKATKLAWLHQHIGSVHFDEIHIINYGTPKQNIGQGILFDDEVGNRNAWIGQAYDVDNIIGILNELLIKERL